MQAYHCGEACTLQNSQKYAETCKKSHWLQGNCKETVFIPNNMHQTTTIGDFTPHLVPAQQKFECLESIKEGLTNNGIHHGHN